jgi:hypothetical protein
MPAVINTFCASWKPKICNTFFVVVYLDILVIWVVMSCSLITGYIHSGGTCCLIFNVKVHNIFCSSYSHDMMCYNMFTAPGLKGHHIYWLYTSWGMVQYAWCFELQIFLHELVKAGNFWGFKIETSGGCCDYSDKPFMLHRMQEIAWVSKQLSASQEDLCYIKLVNLNILLYVKADISQCYAKRGILVLDLFTFTLVNLLWEKFIDVWNLTYCTDHNWDSCQYAFLFNYTKLVS